MLWAIVLHRRTQPTRKSALVFLCLTAFSSVLLAQKQTPAQINNPSIEIEGVKLQLGMTKADVLERCVGTEITKINEDRWIIGKWGTVDFRSGKLVFVDRSWNNVGDDHIVPEPRQIDGNQQVLAKWE